MRRTSARLLASASCIALALPLARAHAQVYPSPTYGTVTARNGLKLPDSNTITCLGTGATCAASGNDSRITGALQRSNALSELVAAGSQAAARANLGLGGAAVLNVGTATGTVAAGDDARIVAALPNVAKTSDLKSRSVTLSGTVVKVGYYAAGDMPPLIYTLSTPACSLNAGAGDDYSQIASATPGYCWMAQLGAEGHFSWAGAVAGGADPYYTGPGTGNAARINVAITALGVVSYNSFAGNTQNRVASFSGLTGDGLIYGIDEPVSSSSDILSSYYHDFSLVGLQAGYNAGNFPCDSTGLLTLASQSFLTVRRVGLMSNRFAINGLYTTSNGSIRVGDISVLRWNGTCYNTTVNVTGSTYTASAVNPRTITLASIPTGLANGRVFHAALNPSVTGIPDLSVIVDIDTSLDGNSNPKNIVTLSKDLTAAPSGSVVFSKDPSGVVMDGPAGGTWENVNSTQWSLKDTENGVAANRYGFSLYATGSANDVAWVGGLEQGGAGGVFMDSGSKGFNFTRTENNSPGATGNTTPNYPGVLMAAGAGSLNLIGGSLGGGTVQATAKTTTQQPNISITGGLTYVPTTSSPQTPAAVIKLWTDVTGAYAYKTSIDTLTTSFNPALPWALLGPGTWANSPNYDYGYKVIQQQTRQGQVLTGNYTAAYSDCGTLLTYGNAGVAYTLTLPATMPGISTNVRCEMPINVRGSGAITIAVGTGATLNGVTNGTATISDKLPHTIRSEQAPSGVIGWLYQ